MIRKLITFLLMLLLAHGGLLTIFSQDGRQLVVEKPPISEKRIALVIGNGAYQKVSPLGNPVNDAIDMSAVLQGLGFEVIKGTDADLVQMRRLIRQFGEKLAANKGIGLFYYAGHGVEVKGKNFLVPVDADISREVETEDYAIDVNSVMRQMDDAGNGFNIVILDACRNNPFSRGWSRSGDAGGLANINAPTGTFIAFAAAPGSTASDGKGTRNGVFTGALIKQLNRPDLKLEEVFKATRETVMDLTGNKQVPWDSSSVKGDFYFNLTNGNKSPITKTEPNVVAKDKPTPLDEARRTELVNKGLAAPVAVTVRKNSIGMEFVWIPPGDFIMGSNDAEIDEALSGCQKYFLGCKRTTYAIESPAHKVTISNGFWMGKFEVTQAQWEAIIGKNPSYNKKCGANCPVEQVSWNEVQEFIKNLNDKNDGFEYRLPSEAEWEYAARAGTTSAYSFGAKVNEDLANYQSHYPFGDCKTLPVGSFPANAWGLFDMLGNVSEWVNDIFNTSYLDLPSDGSANVSVGDQKKRVARGGNWQSLRHEVRSAFRNKESPTNRDYLTGLRIVARIK